MFESLIFNNSYQYFFGLIFYSFKVRIELSMVFVNSSDYYFIRKLKFEKNKYFKEKTQFTTKSVISKEIRFFLHKF